MKIKLALIGGLSLVSQVAISDCREEPPIRQKFELVDSQPINYFCDEPENPKDEKRTIETDLVSANLRDPNGNLFTAIMSRADAEKLRHEAAFGDLSKACRGMVSRKCDKAGKPENAEIRTDKQTAIFLKHRFFMFEFTK